MDYTDEKLNVRCFYLKLLQRAWISLAFCAGGALVFLFMYMAVTLFTRSHTYQADVQIYLHFKENQSDDRVYAYYNAYTWNDIVKSDQVEDLIEETLESDNFREEILSVEEKAWLEANEGAKKTLFSKARMKDVIRIELPSDLRIMWIYVTDKDPIYAAVLSRAAAEAMISFGEKSEVLRSVEIMSIGEPQESVYVDRRLAAVLAGVVCGFFVSLLYLWARLLLSDAIYVPEEAERRYQLPVIGVMAPAGEDVSDMPDIFIREFRENLQVLLRQGRKWKIVTDLSKEGGDKIKLELESLREKVDHALGESEGVHPAIVVKGVSRDSARVISIGEEGSETQTDSTAEVTKDNSDAGKQIVLIAVRAGVEQGVLIEHLISQLRARGEEPSGLLFMSTDTKFLRRYYGL